MRENVITKIVRRPDFLNGLPVPSHFGLFINDSMVQFEAPILKPPQIAYLKNFPKSIKFPTIITPEKGAWNMHNGDQYQVNEYFLFF